MVVVWVERGKKEKVGRKSRVEVLLAGVQKGSRGGGMGRGVRPSLRRQDPRVW